MTGEPVYEFEDTEIDFSASIVSDGDLFRIENNRFDCLKGELYESIPEAKKRILQCVSIRYQSEISDLSRKLVTLRERQNELKNGSVEDILVKLNSADIPF
jgi:hypothetical protein